MPGVRKKNHGCKDKGQNDGSGTHKNNVLPILQGGTGLYTGARMNIVLANALMEVIEYAET